MIIIVIVVGIKQDEEREEKKMWMWDEVQLVMTRKGGSKFPLASQTTYNKLFGNDKRQPHVYLSFSTNLTPFILTVSDYYNNSFFFLVSDHVRGSKWTALANTSGLIFISIPSFIKIIDYKTVLHLMTWLLNFDILSSLSLNLTDSYSSIFLAAFEQSCKLKYSCLNWRRHSDELFPPLSFLTTIIIH